MGGKKYCLEKKRNKKNPFASLTVVFDMLTVCTVEKNFYTELENLLIYIFDIFHYKQLLERLEMLTAFLLEDYKNTTGHAEDSYVLSGMLISSERNQWASLLLCISPCMFFLFF